MFEYFYPLFNGDNQMLIIYSMYEYALHIKDVKLAVSYGNIIEPLIPNVNNKFGFMINMLL